MTTNKYPRGSEWRKWDLHLHTTCSYDYKYNAENADELLVEALLRQNVSVACITDHFVINQAKIEKLRRLAPDIVFFPGVELRTDKGDTNIHVILIFDVLSNLDTLSEDFNVFKRQKGKCIDNNEKIYWDFKDIKDFADEHKALISIHAGRKTNGVDDRITNALDHNQAVKEEFADAVHVFEMGQIRDFDDYRKHVFPTIGIKPMIICSDNHDPRNYAPAHPLWIKADPTFEGLKQILIEPEKRVFVGEKPSLFKTVEDNRTKYIKELSIDAVTDYSGTKGKWFEKIAIPFNKELVAIIGNKGNGKSAISDILAHCCNYKSQEYFSFLNEDKFRNKNLADYFVASVEYEDGQTETKGLSDRLDGSEITRVKYLPQGYFESICNDLQKEENLKSEIEAVVFQYIDEASRLGTSNFKELVDKKADAIGLVIQQLKNKLNHINKDIIALEDKKYPAYKNSIIAAIEQKEKEIEALIVPQVVPQPNLDDEQSKNTISEIEKVKEEIASLNNTIKELVDEKGRISITLSRLNDFIINVDRIVQSILDFKEGNKAFVESLGIDINEIISVSKDISSLEKKKVELESRLEEIDKMISEDSQLDSCPALTLKKKQDEINELKKKLDGPSKAYQTYLQQKEEYEKNKNKIEGDETIPNSLKWLKKEKEYIENQLTIVLQEKVNARNQCLKEIYNKRKDIISIYQQVKSKLDAKITENKSLLNNYEIRIEASLGLKNNFSDGFLRFVNQSRSGSFRGKESGQAIVQEIIRNSDLQTEQGIESFCNSLVEKLNKNDEKEMYIQDQVDDRQALYDYLFSLDYLSNNYSIMQGDKDLSVLSPGEKGALLLVFYLLLDMDNVPLILDQPEDNLDNDSVANILVDFIKEAKKKRQIIMVTHNPNLAVVADAEQVIYVSIDKKDGNKVYVESGSIENPNTNKHIVDVLEGAMPAFRKRDDKYIEAL